MLNNELLNSELRKNPFAVPDKYFDDLPSKVQDKCVMSKRSPVYGLIPKLAWSGGIAILAFTLFLSYFNFSDTSVKKQNSAKIAVNADSGKIAPKPSGNEKNSLKPRRDVMVDYLAVRNVNLNDYLASRY
ncbi:MAG: hypothetical protein LBS55_01855 [Prevotellaceae bacterium]|jgi:hypothetical protein|nr:hypothetical protein [Prevotellaceae bacterium]